MRLSLSVRRLMLPLAVVTAIVAGGIATTPATASHLTGFSGTGEMLEARRSHTATLLLNGSVLIAGGGALGHFESDAVPSLTSAELYEPVSGTFSSTGGLTNGRLSHTATLLPDGRILITGGESVDSEGVTFALSSAELYDPATGLFTETGGMTVARRVHTATLLWNGRVLIAGGSTAAGGPIDVAELYNPEDGTFTTTGTMTARRVNHTATPLTDGRVLLAGGNSTDGTTSAVEIYDPLTATFVATGSMSAARRLHAATLLPDGKVLIVAGALEGDPAATSSELYDPSTGTFSAGPPLAVSALAPLGLSGTFGRHSALLPNGRVLVLGGPRSSGATGAELYDPVAASFSTAEGPAIGRVLFTATLLSDGRVLIVGGEDTNVKSPRPAVTSAEIYEALGNEAPTPIAGGLTLTVAGTTSLEALINAQAFTVESVWKLDIATQSWLSYVPGAIAIANSLKSIAATDIVTLKSR